MPRGAIIGSALSVLMMLAACDSKDTFSVDVAIYFLEDGEEKVVRETYAYDVTIRADWQDSFDGAKVRFAVTGEAIVLRTEPTVVVASYLTQSKDAGRALSYAHEGADLQLPVGGALNWGGAVADLVAGARSETDVPRDHWPEFVEFTDPSDATSQRRGTPLDITRVTVRLSDGAAELGDAMSALPLLEAAPMGRFCKVSFFVDQSEWPDCAFFGRPDFLTVDGQFPLGERA